MPALAQGWETLPRSFLWGFWEVMSLTEATLELAHTVYNFPAVHTCQVLAFENIPKRSQGR